MNPLDAADALAGRLGGEVPTSVSAGGDWARGVVDVPVGRWRQAVTVARDHPGLAFDFFDFLTAVDDVGVSDDFLVVAHLWSTSRKLGVLIRTRAPRATATVPTVVDVYPGAAWHEREAFEMYGIEFTGHPHLVPLLLPPEFEGHPLRKDFVLAARVAKAWPGAKEPGESDHGAPSRRRIRPPGVPDPAEWGPDAGGAEARDTDTDQPSP
jgi:NADH-quinone oxidoreductase subunit C